MKLMWLRFAILRILNKIWPPEEPTAAELLEHINVLQNELNKYQERTYVWIDPTVYRTGAYDAPSPTTDGKLRAEGMQNGTLARHHTEMLRRKAQAERNDPPTHLMRSIHLNPIDDQPLHFETTQVRIPTWLL